MTISRNKKHLVTQYTYTPQQLLLAWVVGIVLCMFVGLLTIKIGLLYTEEEFRAKADLVHDEITRRYSTLEAVLTSLAGFHQASDSVSAVQFSTFAQELLNAYPYILSAVSLHKLDDNGRKAYEAEMEELGYYNFSVTQSNDAGRIIKASQRKDYLIINIIEPLAPHLGFLLGYDIFSNNDLTNAVVNAARTGKGTASTVTNLLNRDGSILVFKAVYQGRYSPTNESDRMSMFNGAIAMEVAAGSLLTRILPDHSNLNVSLILRSTEGKTPYDLAIKGGSARTTERSLLPTLEYKRDLDLYGQFTTLRITQQILPGDINFYWVTLTVISSLIIYVAMLSTWHNLKISRVHEQELEGYAARAAFSEENTDPIMRIDSSGTLLYSNEPGKSIVNNWKTFVGGSVPRNIKEFVNSVLQQDQFQETEAIIGPTHYTLRFVPRTQQNYVNVYGRDDTEQKRSERDLLEAKQAAEAANIAKSRFLATISHEVRTPMNGVLGMLELLRKTELSEKQRGFTENAIRSGKGLLSLINDILDFSKIESNKLKLERAPFNLGDTIDDALQVVAEEAAAKNLELITEIGDIDTDLVGDEQRLRQILINLIGNAVKFTSQGYVRIRVEQTAVYRTGVQLKFEISDSGIGITADALPHIFKDFTQQDDSTTRTFGGTGLGLAITKQLVNMMGGEIHVQSSPNQGSTFWITLQFENQLPERTRRTAQMAFAAEPEDFSDEDIMVNARILLAEDNAINQEVASAMLESAGCEVVAVTDGEKALGAMQAELFDLVLMDCQMPNMDGFEATRTIRQEQTKYPQIPIIALTADIQQGITDQCRQSGMNDYLSKPFTHEALLEMVVKWLPQKAYRQA